MDLSGGINRVVRVGDTVRRPVGFWSASVHELLLYLEHAGFPGAPRFLGIDSDGRECLSLVGGEPVSYGDESLLQSAAQLLRSYHDLVAGWSPPAAAWQVAPVDLGAPEVICHNDLAPWNILSRDGRAIAFVDWDTAAPGPRMWDLAYLAYRLIPLAAPENLRLMGVPAGSVPDRLAALCRGYGCTPEQRRELIALVPSDPGCLRHDASMGGGGSPRLASPVGAAGALATRRWLPARPVVCWGLGRRSVRLGRIIVVIATTILPSLLGR